MSLPWRLGLTGGIASGKSTVARLFAAQGVPVIDLDQVAREVVAPGEPLLEAILARFKAPIRLPDGGLDRRALRELVFADPAARAELDPALAELVDHAALASSRLDQLEAELSPDDLRSDDEAVRASWRVRDRWAARILQVTGFLDAMRARAVMARARRTADGDLDELRAHVAALGEMAT